MHSKPIVYTTYVIFVLIVFFLYIIFMNFIIAVISESYQKVIIIKESHDYKIRALMIYEREILFSEKDFHDYKIFPKILIIR